MSTGRCGRPRGTAARPEGGAGKRRLARHDSAAGERSVRLSPDADAHLEALYARPSMGAVDIVDRPANELRHREARSCCLIDEERMLPILECDLCPSTHVM